MQRMIPALALLMLAGGALAAPKPCEELKQEIEVKIQANNVPSYTLEIVANDDVQDQSIVVGSCDGGTRKIIYQRND
ncbi:DUF1161 domain-containing protein [Ectopseudomonas khazarica]|uniref:DUF1161 domain-containing protein n=1 Tax=Ectopseudomonas khazarica TaxID=2502979 RepID=UPI0037CBDBB3